MFFSGGCRDIGLHYGKLTQSEKIPLSENAMKDKEIQSIICKATDISYNTQPQESRSIWNLRGILNNSWHQVKIVSEQLTKKDKIKQD